MNFHFIQVMMLVFLGSIAGLIGGIVFLIKKDWARKLCGFALPFASGVLLSVSLLHLLPEAVHSIGKIGYFYVLLAFLASFIFEQYFASLHHHEDKKSTMLKSSVPLVIFGDTIHNFIDGVTIATAYFIEPKFGLIVAIATFLHETPHEIGDFGILISAGWSRKKTLFANALSASATFPGAIMVLLLSSNLHDKLGILLAISAGVFLYLGASDFLPEVAEEKKGKSSLGQIILVVLGATIMYSLTFILPEH